MFVTSTALADTAADEAACAKGKPKKCLDAGNHYLDDATKDLPKALELFQKGCDGKVAAACGFASSLLLNGDGITRDEKASFALGEKGCKLGDSRACNNLGTAWSEGKDGAADVDHAKAKQLYEKACKLKNGLGCFNLGNIYRIGEGVTPDLKVASKHFQKSCDLNEAKGCTELAIIYYEGKALKKDQPKAIKLLQKACKLGSEPACKNLDLLKAPKE